MPCSDEKINLLLVDDCPENLISLSAILEHPDYRLVAVESGSDALKHLLEQDFALILIAAQMRIMDGFETATLIKKRESSRNIPILFVTSISPDAPLLLKGYNAGAVDFISKPFEPKILCAKVSVFADLFRKNQQLARQAILIREIERLEHEEKWERHELQSHRRERAASEKYRDLVEGISEGIVWTAEFPDMSMSFISSQAEDILGQTLDGQSHSDFLERTLLTAPILLEKRQEWITMIGHSQVSERDFSFENELNIANGDSIWFKNTVRLSEGTKAGHWELRGLSVDITKLKRAEETAIAAIAVRDQFLTIASHELKTPLTPLCLQLEIMQKLLNAGAPPEQICQKLPVFVDRLFRLTDRLSRLVEELLDVSRINNGKLLLEKRELHFSALVREVCDRFGNDLARTKSNLHLNLEEGIIGAWDKPRLEQVATNLLNNAIKYGEGKVIQVTTGLEDGHAVLRIRDHGIGIATEDQSRIFQLYERAVSPSHFGGLGLGLYIVRQIVEAHGGQAGLESNLGTGSTFWVKIPLNVSQAITNNSKGKAHEYIEGEVLH
jgi:signal transduction histidine kinase